MACTCGHTIRLSETGDRKASRELSQQIRNARNPAERDLLTSQRAILDSEIKTTQVFRSSVEDARRSIVSNLRSVEGQLPNLPRDTVRRIIRGSGLDQAMLATVETGVSSMLPPVYQGISAGVGDLDDLMTLQVEAVDYTETQVLVGDTIGSLFEDKVLPTFEGTINAHVANADLTGDIRAAINNIDAQLAQNITTLATEARTKASALSRAATQMSARLAGLTSQLYSGVVDGLTRPFCREVVGFVFTEEQITQLNNNQNLPVAIYGGGYNCRHGWAPISEGMAERLGKPRASDDTIENANKAARKK